MKLRQEHFIKHTTAEFLVTYGRCHFCGNDIKENEDYYDSNGEQKTICSKCFNELHE